MIAKNSEIQLKIDDLSVDGLGIGRMDGITVFVDGALPGETVRAKIIKQKKNYMVGRLLDIEVPSPDRVSPPCPVFSRCGGCTLQHLSYPAQLAIKHRRVQNCMQRIAKSGVLVSPVLPSKDIFHYRNKASFPVTSIDGQTKSGFYKKRSHEIVPVETCLVQKQVLNDTAAAAVQYMNENSVSSYDEITGEGLVRHIVVRCTVSGDVMAALVAARSDLPKPESLVNILLENVPGLQSVLLNINDQNTNVILGKKQKTLFGNAFLSDHLCGFDFNVSLQSFFQINGMQAQVLYEKAIDFCGLKGSETVADLYCGTGTLTLLAAKFAKKAYGIEIAAPAVADAQKNAARNEISNAEFICGACEDVLPGLVKEQKIDVVLLDPPRKGADERVLSAAAKAAPKKIVYISCDPATLARDILRLSALGYITETVQPVDMFPHTMHVESVTLMSRIIK